MGPETSHPGQAAAEVLQVIAPTSRDLKRSLAAIAEKAARHCRAYDAVLTLRQSDTLMVAAHHGPIPVSFKSWPLNRQWTAGRAVIDGVSVHVHDLSAAGKDYGDGSRVAREMGHRTTLSVPLIRHDKALGAFTVRRLEVDPFTEEQISLLVEFAEHAAIAIENAQLFEEAQARNRELTATSEVLGVISRSPDTQPVFDMIAKSAVLLCNAENSYVHRYDGVLVHLAAQYGLPPEAAEATRRNFPITADNGFAGGRAIANGKVVQIPDYDADPDYKFKPAARLAGVQSALAVPMLRHGVPIGAIVLDRKEAGTFSDRQAELLKTFADQAVIAIENARLFEEVQARNAELRESLEQQTATSDILRVIASSPTEIHTVLAAVAESAAKLCDAHDSVICLRDGDLLSVTAHHGPIPTSTEVWKVGDSFVSSRAVRDGKPIHVRDVEEEKDEFPDSYARASRLGHRTMLGVPLLKDGVAIGVILIRRLEVRPFTQKQIDLSTTFADQAVIAIENARLFDEVQARNREVTEALQQQTATAEVLQVISRSAFDLQTVLDTLVASAARLCGADGALICRRQGEVYPVAATHGISAEFMDYMALHPVLPDRGSATGRAIIEGRPVQVQDVLTDTSYGRLDAQSIGGWRAILAVPLLREGSPIGTIALFHTTPRPFTSRQVELVATFADQAVIAIENVRLFEEVEARTRELQESLDYQTATSEVLGVISRSPTDAQPVFEVIAESSARLCGADDVTILMRDGEVLVDKAHHGPIPAFPIESSTPITREWASGRAILERRAIHVRDMLAEAETFPAGRAWAIEKGYRTTLVVPLLRESEAIGVILLRRTAVLSFTERQIDLLGTFADQAVIAIENVRLFEEEQARNRELTATSEVLRVIARSPTDVQPVLDVVAESAAKLCEAYDASILLREGDCLAWRSHFGPIPIGLDRWPISRDWVTGRAFVDRTTLHIHDALAIGDEYPVGRSMAERMGFRTFLAVPMLRDGEAIGVIGVRRTEVRPFTQRQIDLLTTFADQAVIAIQNVRLFEEVQQRNREIGEALQQQTATAEVLKTISRSAFDLPTVLHALADSAIRLCGANHGGILLRTGDFLTYGAEVGANEASQEFLKSQSISFDRTTVSGRVALSGHIEHIPDIDLDPDYDPEQRRQLTDSTTMLGTPSRAMMGVPLLRDGRVEGVFFLSKQEPGAFTERQAELVQTFADQAVIAIENARLFAEVQARTKELTEALEYQTATSEVLGVISRSPSDLQPVFDSIVATASRLCDAEYALLFRLQGDCYSLAASNNADAAFVRHALAHPIPPGRGSLVGRTALDRNTVHLPDCLADPEFTYFDYQRVGKYRSMVGVPLMRNGLAVGVIALMRADVKPFSIRQIELVTTFADQAVIAIENVRLFEEVQARNREVTEALEQQTATGEILRVIAASPTNIQPVLDAVAESAARLCEAYDAVIQLKTGENLLSVKAHHGSIPITYEHRPIGRDWITGSAFLDCKPLHVHDALNAGVEFPTSQRLSQQQGQRTVLAVPLTRESEAIGVISVRRREVRPFTQKQINLLTTFADQAVIAIENTRLFEEVQARNSELAESLQQQTATAEVLQVISRSAFNLQAVLNTLVDSATRLCEADAGLIFRRQGDVYLIAATCGRSPELMAHLTELKEFLTKNPVAPDRGSTTGRAAAERRPIRIADVLDDPEYQRQDAQRVGRWRATMAVPLLREGNPIGVITLLHMTPRPFTDRQVELVSTFADQGVIAIENVRLFEEVQAHTKALQASLEYQTATSDVLSVISRSPTELQPVLDAIVITAAQLCGADKATIRRRQGDTNSYTTVATHGFTPEQAAYSRSLPLVAGPGSVAGRVAATLQTVHVPDIHAEPNYTQFELARQTAYGSILSVPLLRENELVGILSLFHVVAGPFTSAEIERARTFADQAVIAIENARLFEEVQARTRELSESLDHQTATSELLEVIGRSTTDLQPVFDTLAESAVRLCEAERAFVFRFDGELLRAAAWHNSSAEMLAFAQANPPRLGRYSAAARAGLERKTIHIHDIEADPEYSYVTRDIDPVRTVLAVPMLRGEELLGVTVIYRLEVRPFSPNQVALMETFSDQAVIAIENARLFEEVQARNRDLVEVLDRQSTTADVLSIIAKSPNELQPVLEAIASSALRLTSASDVVIERLEGDHFYNAAHAGTQMKGLVGLPLPLTRQFPGGRAVLDRTPIIIDDLQDIAEAEYPDVIELLKINAVRSVAEIPLLSEGRPLGSLAVLRGEVRPFSDTEVALLETFADQTVIAIENARLFEALQAKTSDLARSVGELEALGAVGQTISSTLDVQAVLTAILTHACQLAGSDSGAIYTFNKAIGVFELESAHNMSDELIAEVRARPVALNDALIGECAARRAAIQIEDLTLVPPHPVYNLHLKAGVRALLALPLVQRDEVVGALVVRRQQTGAFGPATVNLLQAFATQSAIAIHNARLFREMEDKSHQLAVASRHKSQFLANMSHELRTPLNSVLGFAEMLADGLYGELPEKAKITLGRIQANGKHLLGLINDVLDLSKIEAGQLTLAIEDYSIGQIVKAVVATTEPLAKAKGLKLTATVADGLPFGRGDERRISQVLLNLAGNAVKFTDRGSIDITAIVREGGFEVLVRDTGPGIAPEHQQRIFEEFQQIDGSSTRQKGGTGLGLAISKRIVELHGGRIELDSLLGAGSTFRVRLPIRAEKEAGAA